MDWDLTTYFPAFGHPKHEKYEATIARDLDGLLQRSRTLPLLGAGADEQWVQLVVEYESVGSRLSHLDSFTRALAAAEGDNPEYRAAEARLDLSWANFDGITAELRRLCGQSDTQAFDAFLTDERLAGAEYKLTRLRQEMRNAMSPDRERLAAQLGTDGINAWGRLYDKLTAALTFEMRYPDGNTKTLPISARRALIEGDQRDTRRAAFEGGNRAFETLVPTLGAALNHIAGTRLTLYTQRGIDHFLTPALFSGAISRATLDAMYQAVWRRIELPRDVLRLKSKAAGLEQLAWYDLGAPFTGATLGEIDWEQARSMVHGAFAAKYPRLAEFFQHALDQRWVDWRSRPGKRSGAFCTNSPEIKQSRVFMTYGGSLNSVSTLAHEIGHAFHSHLLAGQRWLAQDYPMTLAETASTFAELVLAHGLCSSPEISPDAKRAVQSNLVNDAAIFLLDITVRFEFEKSFYEERTNGEVADERIHELMVESQKRVLGDVLASDGVDPYYWASKLHFFITGVSFYNFPYTFGYLLSRGLFARFEEEGIDFLPRYERFLRGSASAEAHVVVKETLGYDLEQSDFWERSIASLEQPLAALGTG
jgi:oligoendopeptidase F